MTSFPVNFLLLNALNPRKASVCMLAASQWRFASFTTIHAAPKGFEDIAPYTLGIVDLKENGRLLAWTKDISDKEIKIGMPVKVVTRIFEETEEIKLYYTIEKP